LSALVESKLSESSKAVENGIKAGYKWLADNLVPTSIFDDSARVESYNVTYDQDGTSMTWQSAIWHASLPYVLSALVRQPEGPDAALLAQSIRTIVTAQFPDGRWPNPDSAAGMSVWAVWPFLDALADVIRISPLRRGDSVRWITHETMLVSRGADRKKSLRKLVRHGEVSWFRRLSRRYWATAILTLVLLGGASLAVSGLLGWNEFGFALVVPVFLLGVQEWLAHGKGR